MSKTNWKWLALTACVSAVMGLGAGPLLVENDSPRQADAIVVIGGDHKPERIARAAALYRLGYSAVIVISAGTQVVEGGEPMPEAEVMRRQALALDVPETVLLMEDQSQSTYQNAAYTKRISGRYGFKSLLLVTSAFHSKRAARIFREVFDSGVSVWVQPSPPDLCTLCWWFQPDQARVVGYEYYNWALLALENIKSRWRLGMRYNWHTDSAVIAWTELRS